MTSVVGKVVQNEANGMTFLLGKQFNHYEIVDEGTMLSDPVILAWPPCLVVRIRLRKNSGLGRVPGSFMIHACNDPPGVLHHRHLI